MIIEPEPAPPMVVVARGPRVSMLMIGTAVVEVAIVHAKLVLSTIVVVAALRKANVFPLKLRSAFIVDDALEIKPFLNSRRVVVALPSIVGVHANSAPPPSAPHIIVPFASVSKTEFVLQLRSLLN